MKIKMVLTVAVACGALASLGGCASMSKKGDPSALVQPTATNYSVDTAYVNKVNEAAEQSGVAVVWLNPPETSNRH